jgi:hypothetical protein
MMMPGATARRAERRRLENGNIEKRCAQGLGPVLPHDIPPVAAAAHGPLTILSLRIFASFCGRLQGDRLIELLLL